MAHAVHFGCCMACRAPFMQSTEFYNVEESQAIFYLQMRFKQLSAPTRPSLYTGPLHESHILPKSRYSPAYMYVAGVLTPLQTRGPIPGHTAAPRDRTTCFHAPYSAGKDQPEEDADPRARIPAPRRTQKKQYLAHWDAPEPIEHAELMSWLRDIPRAAVLAKQPWVCNPDLTFPCCSLCNTIFDTWARMSDTLRQLVPAGAITVIDERSGNALPAVPRPPTVANYRGHNAKHMAAMAAHYLHACWRGQVSARGSIKQVYTKQQQLVTMLLWLPLHLTTTYLESVRRINAKSVKGDHNYLGNLDHIIAYHQYLCATLADTSAGEVDFQRLSVFYIKELPEAPAPVWDTELHPRVADYIFDDDTPSLDGNPLALVQHASKRLIHLYENVTAPLIPMIKGFPCASRDPAFRAAAENFFIDHRETQALMRDFLDSTNPESIKYFIDHAGTAAILWPNHRYLAREPSVQALVTDWMNARLAHEFNNIADHFPQLTASQAQLLYNMQNMLRPETLLASPAALTSGVEIDIISRIDNATLTDIVQSAPRCSVWKAAQRLRSWSFTVPLVQVPPALGPKWRRDDRRAAQLKATLRDPDAQYPALGLQTPRLAAAFGRGERRAPQALVMLPRRPQAVSTSLSNWASLRARLISSRLAITCWRSDSTEGRQSAPGRDASRRG